MISYTIFSDEYYMGEALKEAQKAYEMGEIPIGAVVVLNRKIIARAHNLTEKLTDVTAHAEMQAITSAANYLNSKYLHECSLYVTIEPCMMCAGALYWSQISKVVYGASDLKRGYSVHGAMVFHPKTEISYGLLEDECGLLLKEFFKERR